jgi:hypothetical protein
MARVPGPKKNPAENRSAPLSECPNINPGPSIRLFEQRLNDWLDDRSDAELTRWVEAAVHNGECFRQLRDQWCRLDAALRRAAPGLDEVDWDRLARAIAEAVDRRADGLAARR